MSFASVLFILAGCTTQGGDLNASALLPKVESGSVASVAGQMNAAWQLSKIGVEKAKTEVQNLKDSAQKIQSGTTQIINGEKLIKEGMSGAELK